MPLHMMAIFSPIECTNLPMFYWTNDIKAASQAHPADGEVCLIADMKWEIKQHLHIDNGARRYLDSRCDISTYAFEFGVLRSRVISTSCSALCKNREMYGTPELHACVTVSDSK